MKYFYKKAVFLIMILGFSCSENNTNPYSEFDNPCTSRIQVVDNSTEFRVEINGIPWIPNKGVNVSFYKNVLRIYAGDSLSQNGIKHTIDIKIDNPIIGYNNVSRSADKNLMLRKISEDNLVDVGYVDCGFVKIEFFDTINKFISGYFHGTIDYPEENLHFDLSNGVFNLPIPSLFCEVSYVNESMNVDLFNNWQLIGLFDTQGNLISHPPCYSSPSINFTIDYDNSTPIYGVTGIGTPNSFGADLDLLDNSELIISGFHTTLVGGPIYKLDFEKRYFGLLHSSNLIYSIDDNILTLINNEESVVLKFVLLR